jgi:host factor-I protein
MQPVPTRSSPRKTSSAANNSGTGQETLYLKSLVERQVQVEIKMRDGERLQGWIEYFDDHMVRLTREGEPNLFVYKHHIHTIAEKQRSRSGVNGNSDDAAGKRA